VTVAATARTARVILQEDRGEAIGDRIAEWLRDNAR
jgi:hypothetical protein